MDAETPLTAVVRRSVEVRRLIDGLHPDKTHLSGGWAVGSKLEPHTS